MISLFRQLRKGFLAEKRVRSYLLYAMGEIVLVVIGILIALQVNTWNEDRHIRKEKNLLLQNLKADFELRKSELVEFDEYFEKEIHALEFLLPLFNDPDGLPEGRTIDSLLSYTANAYSFNESFKLLDLLFNTGRIDLIEGEELKQLLLKWPFLVEETLEEQRILNEIEFSIGFPELARHIAYADQGQFLKFRNYGKTSYTSNIERDYRGLLHNRVYENFLAQRLELIRIMKSDRLRMIESAERILLLIDSELTHQKPDE